MSLALRFLLPLVLLLGLLTWGAASAVHATGRRWFDKDVDLRAQLAVSGAREGLATHWKTRDTEGIRRLLEEITRDERIMASAACEGPRLLAKTSDFPKEFSCASFADRVGSPESAPRTWSEVGELRGGEVHLNAIPILDGTRPLGFVILVHDMSYVERREAASRRFSLVAFAVLAVLASLVTVMMSALSRRFWLAEVRRFLRGEPSRRGFQPLLADVRELVARLSAEEDSGQSFRWTAQRLKQTLDVNLHGEKVIVVANREPYIHERGPTARPACCTRRAAWSPRSSR